MTVLATLAASVFILTPQHLLLATQASIASLFSVSNIFFWLESGYFDTDAHLKPLLHTWSLSVEEQFYLIWPALLLSFVKIKKVACQVVCLVLIGIASLVVSQWYVSVGKASTAFYWMPLRTFEFVIGAMAVYVPARWRTPRLVSVLSVLGLAMIGAGFVGFSEATMFPGVAALLPALGTFLVILAGDVVVTRGLLQNRAALFVGKISYSAYLVHWPLIVLWLYTHVGAMTLSAKLGLVALSLGLGALSWRWVEQPFRYGTGRFCRIAPASAVAIALTFSLCGAIWITQGNPLGKPQALTPDAIAKGKKRRFKWLVDGCNVLSLNDSRRCQLQAPIQTLVFGNSHEPDGYNIWRTAFANEQHNVMTFGTVNGCEAFMKNINAAVPDDRQCVKRLQQLVSPEFARNLDYIVLSSNKPFAHNKTIGFHVIAQVLRLNPEIKVILLGGYLNLKQDCSYYIEAEQNLHACNNPEYITYSRETEIRHRKEERYRVLTALTDVYYISKFDLLCQADDCPVYANREPFTYDKHHLSFGFSVALGEKLRKRYRSIDQILVPENQL